MWLTLRSKLPRWRPGKGRHTGSWRASRPTERNGGTIRSSGLTRLITTLIQSDTDRWTTDTTSTVVLGLWTYIDSPSWLSGSRAQGNSGSSRRFAWWRKTSQWTCQQIHHTSMHWTALSVSVSLSLSSVYNYIYRIYSPISRIFGSEKSYES